MNLVSTLLICLVGFISTQARVIEITAANIQLVLRSTGNLLLLLNNPTCEHSRSYADRFVQIKGQEHLGIVDCSKDRSVCQHLNATYYPALFQLTKTTVRSIDQYQFLIDRNVLDTHDERISQKSIVSSLNDEQHWVAVVLEEEHLPIIDRLPESLSKRVVYISNPSRIHSALFEMVGRQQGCWILKKGAGELQKYYCGRGYRAEEVDRQLSNFLSGKLERHIFSRQSNSSYIQYGELQQMVANVGRRQTKCKLIYFHSKACQHCDVKDAEKVQQVLAQIKKEGQYDVQIFDMDVQMLPKGLKLPRVPQLIQFCQGKANYFGDVFTVDRLQLFLRKEGRFTVSAPKQQTVATKPEGGSQL